MKKAFCLLYGIIILAVLCSCRCEHTWVNATCAAPVTCSECGETAGEPLGHAWQAATCTTPKSCSVCHATEGPATGHVWQAATCTTSKTCSVCKAVEGAVADHTWQAATCFAPKTCSVCHATEGVANEHAWQAATCTAPKTCSVCQMTEGTALGHVWQATTCTAPKTCSVCQITEGAPSGHVWQAATCTAPKTCSVCKTTEGSAVGHQWKEATCTTAKTCAVCGKTDGKALGHTTGGETCSRCGVSIKTTAEKIYEQCSSAVAYIEVYNAKNEPLSSGSGFFISSKGHFVTCYHVIEGASSAKIQTNDKKVYDVVGVYDYSEENDWAVLKINGNSFPYLTIGKASTYAAGSDVYAIGSPLGLSDTISAGIISNPNRQYNGTAYIQTTASISHGSSGGALINRNGKVIGITAASFEDGQSLNLAVPLTYIEGYKTAEATPLSTLFAPAHNLPDIYNYLCYILVEHSNSSFNDGPSYRFAYSEKGIWRMFYESDGNYIVIADDYIHSSGMTYYCYLLISEDLAPYQVIYSRYPSMSAKNPSSHGSGCINNPKEFNPDVPFSFTRYEGDYRSTDESIVSLSVAQMLSVLDYILSVKFSSSFSAADLGFSNY